ncbi:sorbosone dehydrogenase family protein [Frateuria sp. STR12]|nr:sorbosone dehydrogenase family protein [Frateuria sp. STR12]MCX7514703.1 sorbosone dehydrogenase family protein [Frateuria sp. STR12]
MPFTRHPFWLVPCLLALAACGVRARLPVTAGMGPDPVLPRPNPAPIPTVDIAPAEGWQSGARPTAAPGLAVQAFARGLEHPRWLLVLPNGDVLVAETNAPPRPQDASGPRGWVMHWVQKRAGAAVPSPDRITLLRDADGDGVAETRSVLLDHLHSPFGMALVGNVLYVADTDALLRFPYREGETRIDAAGTRIADLPAGPINHHWTKNVVASPDGKRLYVSVGSNSNAAENGLAVERDRARILEIDPATGATQVFATGLRNPVGMAWQPTSEALWVAVNERDELGSDLVPDYMTAVREGAFYGWPYSYYGSHVDERVEPQNPAQVARAVVPDYALGAHTASLGLAFYGAGLLPQYRNGAFVGQHGSWNRKPLSGYRVIFVPFTDGKPAGPPQDVLTGFVDEGGHARGRPVGVAVARDGALLVADDVGNTIWRIAPDGSL